MAKQRGNREARKPKSAKTKPPVAQTSPFAIRASAPSTGKLVGKKAK